MNYKTFVKIQGIETDVPVGATLIENNSILYYEGKKVCYVASQKSHDCVSLDDGNAEERFTLTHKILSEVAKINAEYQLAYEEANVGKEEGEEVEIEYPLTDFFQNPLVQSVRHNGYWSHEFFTAPIEKLREIFELL